MTNFQKIRGSLYLAFKSMTVTGVSSLLFIALSIFNIQSVSAKRLVFLDFDNTVIEGEKVRGAAPFTKVRLFRMEGYSDPLLRTPDESPFVDVSQSDFKRLQIGLALAPDQPGSQKPFTLETGGVIRPGEYLFMFPLWLIL